LLHYKFDIDLAAKVEVALRERQHWQGSREYEAYARIFSKPCFDLRYKGTRRFEGVKSLVEAKVVCFGDVDGRDGKAYNPPLTDIEAEVWKHGDYALQKRVWEEAWGAAPESHSGTKTTQTL
jgi:hypothetical protein